MPREIPGSAIVNGRQIVLGAIGNLPLVLFCTFGYVVFFSQVWGPVRPWKVIVLALIVLGLCLGLDVGRFGRVLRRPARFRGHAAAARVAWPPWRRAAALLAGSLLAFAGLYQSLGFEVNLARMIHESPRREAGFQARWGGVGSGPAPRVWMPGSSHAAEPPATYVPERLRRVHLLRRVRSRTVPTSPSAIAVFAVLLLGMLTSVVLLWIGW